MTDITVLVGVIGAVIAILTYFAGVKRTSNGDIEKRARFEGNIEAKLDELLKSIDKLESKLDKSTDDLYSEIKRQIAEHEKRYHNDASK